MSSRDTEFGVPMLTSPPKLRAALFGALAAASSNMGCYFLLDSEELDAKGDGVAREADELEPRADAGSGSDNLGFSTSLDTPPIELDDLGTTTRDPCVPTTRQAREILTENCAECHAPPGAAGGFNSILDFPALMNARSGTVIDPVSGEPVRLLIPGEPEQSRLYLRAQSGEMPPLRDPSLPRLPRPTTSDLSILHAWISSCLAE